MNQCSSCICDLDGELLNPSVKLSLVEGRLGLRPLGPADLDLEVNFLSALSSEALYQRVMGTVRVRSLERIRALLEYEIGPSMALGAVLDDGEVDIDGCSTSRLIAVARYAPSDEPGIAEMGIVVADSFRGRGLASVMLERVHEIARACGYREIKALTFAANRSMLALGKRLGYRGSQQPGDGMVKILRLSLAQEQTNPRLSERPQIGARPQLPLPTTG